MIAYGCPLLEVNVLYIVVNNSTLVFHHVLNVANYVCLD